MPIAVKKRRLQPKTILLIFLSPIVLLILYFVVMTYVVFPIQDSYAKLRFEELNTQMKRVYKEVLATAGDKEVWGSQTKCKSNFYTAKAGYTCELKISTTVLRNGIEDIDNLQKKYYPIFNSLTFISPRERLLTDTYRDTGSKDYIKSAYIRYSSPIDDSIDCSYYIYGDRLGSTLDFYASQDLSSKRSNDTEVSFIDFKCNIYTNRDFSGQ